MKKSKKLIIVVFFIYIIFNGINIFADTSREPSPDGLAVALVIDNSSSMAETDSEKLRETAANIFIDLLSPEDYLSIITFNSSQEVVFPMGQIGASENKESIKRNLSQKIVESGYTDYLGAFNEASNQLNSINKGNVRKVILFLTDGEPIANSDMEENPELMDEYMDSLMDKVSDLALSKYKVYSVGFSSGVDSAILEEISKVTQGGLKISNDSSELALSFFDILGSLKNRKEFFNETFEIKGSHSLDFHISDYTSQATMVFANDNGTHFDIEVISPDGEVVEGIVSINEADKYKIVTINKENEKLKGNWKINFSGEGNIRAFGNEDLFIKSRIVSPDLNSLQPLNESLEISVNVAGHINENISMEAVILKDGVEDSAHVKLLPENDVFKGVYKGVDKEGKYDVNIEVMINGEVVTINSTSIIVKDLPVIVTNFFQEEKGYRLGEAMDFSASLEMKDYSLIKNTDLVVENYNLVLDYAESGTETIPLLYNGLANGSWESKVLFDKNDSGKAYLIVNGTYKGESFLIEKLLGDFNVYPSGNVLVKSMKNIIATTSKNKVKIPIEIESTSNFTETITITIDEAVGNVDNNIIQIKPLEKINTDIYVNLIGEKKNYDVVFNILSENEETIVEDEGFKVKLKVISKTQSLVRSLKNNMGIVLIILGLVIGIPLAVIMIGLLLYMIFVYNNTLIKGCLLYWKEADLSIEEKNKFDFSKSKKSKIVITFNYENKKAQHHILDSRYSYDIELSTVIEKGKWKFIDGYKALFNRNNNFDLLLKTTEPGIFIYENKAFTSKKIYRNDIFISGDYVFQYIAEDKKEAKAIDKGKNVLSK